MKHIFIIGSRGYKAKYGGWETFVTNLVDNYNDDNTIYYNVFNVQVSTRYNDD